MKGTIGSVLLWFVFSVSPSFATTALKDVVVGDSGRVELVFDGKISKNQIQTEFLRDIVQLTMENVSVYPAKITSVNQADLRKIFIYQYSPKTVRARFSVAGKAEDYQSRVAVSANGKEIVLKIGGVPASPSKTTKAPKPADTEEQALLAKIIKSTQGEEAQPKVAAQPKETQPKTDPAPIGKSNDSAFGKMMFKVLIMLLVVLGCFAAGVLIWKKIKGASPLRQAVSKNTGVRGMLARLIPGARSPAMIEVVGNHYLGPKKNICVVKIQGRTLVLGVTPDSINLISQLSGTEPEGSFDIEGITTDQAASGVTGMIAPSSEGFDRILGQEKEKPATTSARERIRRRLENMKPL